jgi:ABC-type nitrate/sulfonate/bicarbonate transport system substrate-binding protein
MVKGRAATSARRDNRQGCRFREDGLVPYFRLFLVSCALTMTLAAPALAADKIRAGKATGETWGYLPLDVGVEEGIFAKYGLDVEVTVLSGGARFQQALVSDSIDVGLSGSTAMAQTVKGSPVIAIAATVGAPRGFAVVVAYDSPIKTVADLKGKTISFATNGSLPDWLVRQLAIGEGWGKGGVKGVALGSVDASIAAVQAHQIDAIMTATEVGLQLQEIQRARVVTDMGKYAPTMITQVAYAGQSFARAKPQQVQIFVNALFATVAFMKANKEKTVAISARVFNRSQAVMDKAYDFEITTMVSDGQFSPEGLEVMKDSFVDLAILPEKPTDDQILTRQFVPAKP